MIYLFDEDGQHRVPKLGYIDTGAYKGLITWFRDESEVTIKPEDITDNDIVCYHNSFPVGKKGILKPIIDEHESKKGFKLVCFSGDISFYNGEESENYLKLHKDKFYLTLQNFIDNGYNLDSLKYGNNLAKNESSVIINRIFEMLFNASDADLFDPRILKSGDLKRLCELTGQEYESFLGRVDDITIEDFRKIIIAISKNA